MFSRTKQLFVVFALACSIIICDSASAQIFRAGSFGGFGVRAPFVPVAPPLVRPVLAPVVLPSIGYRGVAVPRVVAGPVIAPRVLAGPAIRTTRTTTVAVVPVAAVAPVVRVPVAVAPTSVARVAAPVSYQYSYSAGPSGFSFQSRVAPTAPIAAPQPIYSAPVQYSVPVQYSTPVQYDVPVQSASYETLSPSSTTVVSPSVSVDVPTATPVAPASFGSSVIATPETTSTGNPLKDLITSAKQLNQSIASMSEDDSEVWVDFLAPEKVAAAAKANDLSVLTSLLKNYDGVAGNKDLTNITSMTGFAQTRQQMRQIVGPEDDEVVSETAASADKSSAKMMSEEPTAETDKEPAAEADNGLESIESLPVPMPEPDPEFDLGGPTLAEPIKQAE